MGRPARHGENREAERWLAGLTSTHNPPIAEAGLQSPAGQESQGAVVQGQGQEPSEMDTCKRQQKRMARDRSIGVDPKQEPGPTRTNSIKFLNGVFLGLLFEDLISGEGP